MGIESKFKGAAIDGIDVTSFRVNGTISGACWFSSLHSGTVLTLCEVQLYERDQALLTYYIDNTKEEVDIFHEELMQWVFIGKLIPLYEGE